MPDQPANGDAEETGDLGVVTSGKTGKERSGGRFVAFVIAGIVLLFGGGYVAAYYAASEKVPRGTSIGGVDVGGLTPADAAAALREEFESTATSPLTLTINGETTDIQPTDAGLTVDYEASVAEAGGGTSWNPSRLWDYWTGGDDLDVVTTVDEQALAAALEPLDDDVATEPVDGRIGLAKGRVRTFSAKPGRALDVDSAVQAVADSYPSGETVELELTEVQPEIDEADVQAAVDSFANPALAGPITLQFGDSPVTLRPRDFAPALSMEPANGELVPNIDEQKIGALVESATADAGAPVDATVRLVNGKPRVVPSKPGVTFETGEIVDTVLGLLTQPTGQRTAEVDAQVDEADFTTADARALKIKEEVSTFSTFFPYAEYRNVNIGRAAEIIDGYVLKPGETFSVNDTVGERTRENGFTEGFVISNGVFRQDLGGGVSQMATTLFNAMFFAGLEDVEHKPHSLYIDRYPVGREATLSFGTLDLRFKNDTPYGVLIDTNVVPSTPGSQGEVNVTMYSTKTWDITTDESPRYNFTSPGTRTLSVPDCEPFSGVGGFTIDVFRYFRKPGQDKLERTEKFTTVYNAGDRVICE